MTDQPLALVTGASSGIGAATARKLAEAGYKVICVARRFERVHELAADIGGIAVRCDVSIADDVAMLAEAVGDRLELLVNNAGGAVGLEPVERADFAAWETMYASNVIGAAQVTKALLPAIEAAEGAVIFVTSIAANGPYEGGAGYNAAKAGERMVAGALRLELCGRPIRVARCPGMPHRGVLLTSSTGTRSGGRGLPGHPGPL